MTTPVILDEETYTRAISFIIERDFFPELPKIKAQQNYWEAQTRGSLADLHEAGRVLHDLNNKKENNGTDGQPVNYYSEKESELEKRVNLSLSLDQFQTLYTSEDNASFSDLLEKANIKRREQNKWFFDRETNKLRIKDTPHEEGEKPNEAIDTTPTGWKYKARNTLMYFPEGQSESWVNDHEGRGEKKTIDHKNTHLLPISEMKPPVTNLAPSDRAAAQGNATPWNQLKDGDIGELEDGPDIRGYRLVEATPTLSPSRVGSPLMTWGSIEGTPLLVSGSETPGPRFSLPKVSRREELGMKLSEKASKAYRKKISEKERNVRGTPRSGAGLMSPAAQYLYKKSHQSPYLQSGFDDALRNCYGGSKLGVNSPRGIKRPGATPTPIPLFRAGATPKKIEKPL
ncbi:nuclear protein DGCR14 [Pilobolus umbonatus]|nr:nuclear protein DGCR14 [Pilobolus umbonatus]